MNPVSPYVLPDLAPSLVGLTPDDDGVSVSRGLATTPRAMLKIYPALDHRFVAGRGPSSPAQYETPAHVDAQVVNDIAAWVRALPVAS
jgi:hypothetical protein